MNIKNYTSTVAVSQSIARIEEMLVEIGASNINKKYENKICKGVTFLYFDTKLMQSFAFHLEVKSDEVFKTLWKDIIRPKADTKERLIKQSEKTAWKILSDWAEIQCSLIMLGQAEPLQMFLPFMYDVEKDETLYNKIITGKSNLLLNQ